MIWRFKKDNRVRGHSIPDIQVRVFVLLHTPGAVTKNKFSVP
ncbi:MAG: hypothetical protein PHF18_05610 [Methanosarcina sp.]|nr:hypothetical protein [Methanosarcina sp.]